MSIRPAKTIICLTLVYLCALSCDEPKSTPGGSSVNLDLKNIKPHGSCEVTGKRLGGFKIEDYLGNLIVSGKVTDAPLPSTYLEEVDTQGGCHLYRIIIPSCSPACEALELCNLNQVCVPYPHTLDLGAVVVQGLSSPLEMTTKAPGYKYSDTSMYVDEQTPGAPLGVAVRGGPFGDMDLFAFFAEPLKTKDTKWVLSPNKDLSLSWEAPTINSDATIIFYVNIDMHGVSPLRLVCEFDDTGAATVPADILTRLIEAGVTGFPNGVLTRQTSDHVDTSAGCIELAAQASFQGKLEVPGSTPCDDDDDCPKGQTCNKKTQQCE